MSKTTKIKTVQQAYISGEKALASFLGMSDSCCRNLIKRGLIPKRYIGKKTIFKISEVEEAISNPSNI
ncbi:MAG: helix-turn-helix domain-containing protein [Tenacibaculum sp.]|nr:helix-turn-helix domain-containing protein [Tenacibaculum sp.]